MFIVATVHLIVVLVIICTDQTGVHTRILETQPSDLTDAHGVASEILLLVLTGVHTRILAILFKVLMGHHVGELVVRCFAINKLTLASSSFLKYQESKLNRNN